MMQLTKIERKELKEGDLFCEIGVRLGSPVRIALEAGDDCIEVYRIDAPEYVQELTRFSWKLKQLDDKIELLHDANDQQTITEVKSECCNALIIVGDFASECSECGGSVNPDDGKPYPAKTACFGGIDL